NASPWHGITVSDNAGNHDVRPDTRSGLLDLQMHHGLAATDRDDGYLEILTPVDTADHLVGRNRWRKIVVFVAITAGEIAPARWYNVGKQYVFGGGQPPGYHLKFSPPQLELI